MSARTTVTSYFVRRITSRSRNRYAACLCGLRGKDFLTSGPIVSIDGRKVTTRSGSVYTLDGPPRWPGENYDDDNPLASDGVSFYLDTPGADVWPPGAAVPEVSDVD